ncbi:telomere-protecting terminal protein Tpg [Streptomyces himalayensis]|uniref:telomere-protecting terminal protein Tpg n=1 Tax=Streptomyces himalayensis TaxID=2820085 RepID=UPI00403E3B14
MQAHPSPRRLRRVVKLLRDRGAALLRSLVRAAPFSTRRSPARAELAKPQKKLQAALVEETASEWQPQVRAQARERAATTGGMQVEVHAYFGFTCTGSSDDGRDRFISTPISPAYAAQILQLQEAGATEEELHPVVAQAITESYFTDWGTRAEGPRGCRTWQVSRASCSRSGRRPWPGLGSASRCGPRTGS